MGEVVGGGSRRKNGGEGQREPWPNWEEGNAGQSVPGVTGAWVPAPQGVWD